MPVLALTVDLDDTLWPVAPVIERAERLSQDWLARHAPRTAAQFDLARMRALRASVGRAHPELAHDLSRLRLFTLRQALEASGDDPALAEPAFDFFLAERQRVAFYPEVATALDRLASRYRLLSLSNGNADLRATGLEGWFCGALSAREAGVAKPDARIFALACERLGLAAEAVLHVGDDLALDVDGALRAGLQAAWVRRDASASAGPVGELALVVRDLAELADRLGC